MRVLVFLIPVTIAVEVNALGTIYLAELCLIGLLPILLVLRGKLLNARLLGLVLFLGLIYLAAQIATDMIRDTPFSNYARGWSRILFLLLSFVSLYLLIANQRPRLMLFAAGLLAGNTLSMLLTTPIASIGWKFGWAGPVTTLVLLGFALVPRLHNPKSLIGPLAIILLGALSVLLNFRSWGGILFVAAAFLGTPALVHAMGLRPKPLSYGRLAGIGILLLAIGFGALKLYGFAAETGRLGQEAKDKYEAQAALGDIGILLGGRNESLVSVQAISDSPIIGHGSWAENKRYAELKQQLLYRLGFTPRYIPPETDLIPTHSHLLGAWVEAGVGGAIFWFGVLLLSISALRRLYASDDPLRPYLVFLMFLFVWDILFSPFGAQRRLTNGYLLVAMLFALQTSMHAWRQRKTQTVYNPLQPAATAPILTIEPLHAGYVDPRARTSGTSEDGPVAPNRGRHMALEEWEEEGGVDEEEGQGRLEADPPPLPKWAASRAAASGQAASREDPASWLAQRESRFARPEPDEDPASWLADEAEIDDEEDDDDLAWGAGEGTRAGGDVEPSRQRLPDPAPPDPGLRATQRRQARRPGAASSPEPVDLPDFSADEDFALPSLTRRSDAGTRPPDQNPRSQQQIRTSDRRSLSRDEDLGTRPKDRIKDPRSLSIDEDLGSRPQSRTADRRNLSREQELGSRSKDRIRDPRSLSIDEDLGSRPQSRAADRRNLSREQELGSRPKDRIRDLGSLSIDDDLGRGPVRRTADRRSLSPEDDLGARPKDRLTDPRSLSIDQDPGSQAGRNAKARRPALGGEPESRQSGSSGASSRSQPQPTSGLGGGSPGQTRRPISKEDLEAGQGGRAQAPSRRPIDEPASPVTGGRLRKPSGLQLDEDQISARKRAQSRTSPRSDDDQEPRAGERGGFAPPSERAALARRKEEADKMRDTNPALEGGQPKWLLRTPPAVGPLPQEKGRAKADIKSGFRRLRRRDR